MKKVVYVFAFIAMIFIGSGTLNAQCNPNVSGAIRCGYYDAGYRDGTNDARANRSSDYRRYRNKYNSQNESFYRDGYQRGFASVQQPSYPNPGYPNPGYPDPGYPNPGYPTASGTATWSGRVDSVARLILQGNSIQVQDVSGTGATTTYQNVNGGLPRRSTIVTADKRDGRGNVSVIQQPSRGNGYTAIVEISDSKGGGDNYRIDLSWQGQGGPTGPGREEVYRSGSARWRGRVDQDINVVISGGSITTEWVAGGQTIGELANVNGNLARRSGTVRVRKLKGRGNVSVLEQPSWQNDFTAVIRIDDPKGGADYYDIQISW
ncbi:MAG TPA: hypothetical protein VGJ02_08515 [Pyrinomonadaceae bacterium]